MLRKNNEVPTYFYVAKMKQRKCLCYLLTSSWSQQSLETEIKHTWIKDVGNTSELWFFLNFGIFIFFTAQLNAFVRR